MELNQAWIERSKLSAEGVKLWAESDKLNAEGRKLFAEGSKLRAESYKLYAEGRKLRAEGDLIWANAVLENCGNTTIEYKNGKCILGTGQTFEDV